MYDFVAVPVPSPLVPRVFRLVADFLGEGVEPETPRVRDETWADVADRGDREVWWQWLRPSERDLLWALKAAPGHSLEAVRVAGDLGLSPSALAGVLGPLNRRSRRDGYPTPVHSRQVSAHDGSGRRIKVLSLEPGVTPLIPDPERGPVAEPPVRVRRRPRSPGREEWRRRQGSSEEGSA